MFADFDLDKLKIDKYDGRSWKAEYKPQVNE